MVEVTRVDGFLIDHANAPGGKQFRFTADNLRRFGQYLNLLAANYDPDLLDPESVIREELKLTKLGGYATPHVIVVAEEEHPQWTRRTISGMPNTKIQVVAAASGNMMPIKMGDKVTERSAFGILSYSPPEVAGTDNLTYEAVNHLTGILDDIAMRRKRHYLGEVVEAEPSKVEIYRSWGFQVLEGVPYLQPVLDWNRDGRPVKQEVELPLMVRTAYGTSLNGNMISMMAKMSVSPHDFALEVVNALYDWTIPSRDEFPLKDKRAERNAVQYHETMRDKVLDAMLKPGNEVRLVLD